MARDFVDGMTTETARRISRAVQFVERHPFTSPNPFQESIPLGETEILQGKLDESLSAGTTTATMSVYFDTTDTNRDIEVRADDFIGYLYSGTWCHVYHDGKYWRVLFPQGYSVLGKFDAQRTSGGTGTFSVHSLSTTSTVDTTDDITALNLSGVTAETTDLWVAQWMPDDGQWLAGPYACS